VIVIIVTIIIIIVVVVVVVVDTSVHKGTPVPLRAELQSSPRVYPDHQALDEHQECISHCRLKRPATKTKPHVCFTP
jgi:hypothetical protein